MSVNTELQALLTKMGGTPSEEDSNGDLIKKISNAYEGGVGSSGGGMFITNVIEELAPDEDEEDPAVIIDNGHYFFRLDKTAGEIENAFLRGMVIVVHNGTDYYFSECIRIMSNESSYDFVIYMPVGYGIPSFSSEHRDDYPSSWWGTDVGGGK